MISVISKSGPPSIHDIGNIRVCLCICVCSSKDLQLMNLPSYSHGSPFFNFGHIITNKISELSTELEYLRKNLNFNVKPIQ